MNQFLIVCVLFIFPFLSVSYAEENFLLVNGITDEVVFEMGNHLNERITPCCTFNIVLSLIGYEEGVLKDEQTPLWEFQKGYVDDIESWKSSQTPHSWIKNSCVWYSHVLAKKLRLETIQPYLASFEYGNQEMSGGIKAWINSSLTISAKEQVDFIQKMI